MSTGQCMNYLDKYKTYCNKVYALDKKVSRSSEETRLKRSSSSLDAKYFDDYDNMCSVDNLLENYPELLPSNLEINKEIELINLSEKNNMDIGNPNVNDYSMEGLYSKEGTTGEHIAAEYLANSDPALTDEAYKECNREALKKGYNFFTVSGEEGDRECKMVNLENENDVYNTNKKSMEDCGITNQNGNEIRNGSNNCYFVSKARKPEDLVVIKCWEDIIRNYPYQGPGVWMHPYINNIRIVFTTFNTKKYNDHKNDLVHPHKENLTNYNIETIHNIPEHAAEPPQQDTESKGSYNTFNPSTYNAYREYFDIENIPIQEKFHLAIVANEKTIEVYINGVLKTSQVLFGDPKYNDGKLQINPGKKGFTEHGDNEDLLLGGTISHFKYFPFNINASNVKSAMENTTSSQRLETALVSKKEYSHNIEVAHEHSYDQDVEQEHRHGVDDSNIPEQYYIE